MIVGVARPGELLGLSAVVSGRPYELSAETLIACQVNFIARDDFLRFMRLQREIPFCVVRELGENYSRVCREIRFLGLSHSMIEKLAKLLLEWGSAKRKAPKHEPFETVRISQDTVGEMIGASRETVTRMLSELKSRHIVQAKKSGLLITNKSRLRKIAEAGMGECETELSENHGRHGLLGKTA